MRSGKHNGAATSHCWSEVERAIGVQSSRDVNSGVKKAERCIDAGAETQQVSTRIALIVRFRLVKCISVEWRTQRRRETAETECREQCGSVALYAAPLPTQ
jgi:hypothetical protein